MQKMRALLGRVATHLTCPWGATTAEYALILALIVIALMGTLGELRNALAGKLQEVIQELRR